MFNPVRAITATVFVCALILTVFFALKVDCNRTSFLGKVAFVCGIYDNPNFIVYLVFALISSADPEAYFEAIWCIEKLFQQAPQQNRRDWPFRHSLYGSKR